MWKYVHTSELILTENSHSHLEFNLPPVAGRLGFEESIPRLIEDSHDLLGQWPLFQILEVRLQLAQTADADDDAVVAAAVRGLEQRMVLDPAQCCLDQGEVVLGHYRLDHLEGGEVDVVEIALAVHLSRMGGRC